MKVGDVGTYEGREVTITNIDVSHPNIILAVRYTIPRLYGDPHFKIKLSNDAIWASDFKPLESIIL